jgi:hypothetical protein
MKCDDVRNLIAVVDDDVLTDNEGSVLREHLAICPLCRQENDDIRNLARDLRMMRRPSPPNDVVITLRNRLSERLVSVSGIGGFWIAGDRRPWWKAWLVPSGIGTFASVLGAAVLLWLISLSAASAPSGRSFSAATRDPRSSIVDSELGLSGQSPSINPQGALVALTSSLVRGEMKDDEVVVVAEVFGNGLAKIDEVVEPSRDRHAVYELEKALKSDPAFAPFVPAERDRRPDSIRVILKIQNVNVSTRVKAKRL